MNSLISTTVILAASVGLALGGLFLVRRFYPHEVRHPNNEVAGFFLAVLGVVYAVLLAFLVVSVWEDYIDARSTTEQEANAALDVYRLADGLPDPVGDQIQQYARTYVEVAIADEWPAMRSGTLAATQDATLAAMWPLVTRLDGDEHVDVIQAAILGHLADLSDHRRLRHLAASEGLPAMMWILLIGGAVVTVVFTYFFGTPNPRAQYAMTALYTVVIAFVIALISLVVFPFRGDISIPPEAFEQALRAMGGP